MQRLGCDLMVEAVICLMVNSKLIQSWIYQNRMEALSLELKLISNPLPSENQRITEIQNIKKFLIQPSPLKMKSLAPKKKNKNQPKWIPGPYWYILTVRVCFHHFIALTILSVDCAQVTLIHFILMLFPTQLVSISPRIRILPSTFSVMLTVVLIPS